MKKTKRKHHILKESKREKGHLGGQGNTSETWDIQSLAQNCPPPWARRALGTNVFIYVFMRVSHCSSKWPRTHYVVQGSLVFVIILSAAITGKKLYIWMEILVLFGLVLCSVKSCSR